MGRRYVADVWDYDVYSEIGEYEKPVLLMHGDRLTIRSTYGRRSDKS